MDTQTHTFPALTPDVIDRFIEAAGPGGALVGGRDDLEKYLVEWRGLYRGETPLVLRPGSVEAVSAIVKIAAETGTPLVPQGGNTGLVGGQIPDASGGQVIVSLERMNKVRAVDALNNAMVVDAGCTLQSIQDAASEIDRLFPLSLASEGSCQVGGVISTNAGGTAVLRYGSMRDLVLGLEAVLPNGEIWNGLTSLRKDNTGYDLTRLLAGAEGTLGIITGAVLKLYPAPKATETAFVAVRDPQAAVELLARLQDVSGGLVATFEIIKRSGFELVLRHFEDAADPFGAAHEWYVLVELTAGTDGWLRGVLEQGLGGAMEAGLVLDAVLAESETQRQALWALRENMSEAQKLEGASIKHDVSVPVSRVPNFLEQATRDVEAAMPGIRPVPFGHIGDGNIHFNMTQPEGGDTDAFLARWSELSGIINDIALDMNGSISAEHGIGQSKTYMMEKIKSPVEYEMLQGLKELFDPNGILNPGKVLP